MTALTPAEVLDQIAARADAATDGPWFAGSCHHPSDGSEHTVVAAATTGQFADLSESFQPEADAAFIAHSRHDVPRLVAALRAVLAEAHAADESASHDPDQECGLVHTHHLRAAITSALGGEA